LNAALQLIHDDVNDSSSHVSLSSESLREANGDGVGERRESIARNAVGENLESAQSAVEFTTHVDMLAVSDEEHEHVLTGKGQEPRRSTDVAYKDHQSQLGIDSVAEQCRLRADELSQQEHRPNLITADDNYATDNGHGVATEPDNAVSLHYHHAGRGATVDHDIVPLPQPSTGRSKTSEHMSYKDDFTEISDNLHTRSAVDSRSVQLFIEHHSDEQIGCILYTETTCACSICHHTCCSMLCSPW